MGEKDKSQQIMRSELLAVNLRRQKKQMILGQKRLENLTAKFKTLPQVAPQSNKENSNPLTHTAAEFDDLSNSNFVYFKS